MSKNTDYIENEIAVDEDIATEQTVVITDSCRCPEPTTCNCCCTTNGTVTFAKCDDFETISPTAQLLCTGRLLTVNVSVTACIGRTVAVGVLLCDANNNPIRFKVCENVILGTPTPQRPCASQTFTFCFVFKKDLCNDTLSFTVKTIADYVDGFGFNCTC